MKIVFSPAEQAYKLFLSNLLTALPITFVKRKIKKKKYFEQKEEIRSEGNHNEEENVSWRKNFYKPVHTHATKVIDVVSTSNSVTFT